MLKILAVYDTDASYAARLTEFIRNENTGSFDVTVFTRSESLEEFLKHGEIELLLLGEEIIPEELPTGKIKYLVKLTDRKTGNQSIDIPLICKYQSARGVLSDILSCYARLENSQPDCRTGGRPGECRIISIFTPLEGFSEMTYSRFYAAHLAERYKCLYLPFELFPVPTSEEAQEMDHAQSEFIFYLKENSPELLPKLKSLLKYSGRLSVLSGVTHGLDLISLTKEDAVRFIGELRRNSEYVAIVIYLSIYTEFTIELMKLSDNVQILVQESDYAGKVMREWERQMAFYGVDTGLTKFIRISLPTEKATLNVGGFDKEQQYVALRQLAVQQAECL